MKRRISLALVCLLIVSGFIMWSPVRSQSLPSLTTDLRVDSQGGDVVTLQTFLEKKGFLVMPPGLPKGYFGSVTRDALASYQASQGISPASGYFGPLTRARVNAQISSVGVVPATPITVVQSSIPSSLAALSSDLTLDSQGEEVVKLQTFLEEKGLLTLPPGVPKGYFGNLTKTAVIAYQLSNNISPALGYVGQLTRAKVNSTPSLITKTTAATTVKSTDTDSGIGGSKETEVVKNKSVGGGGGSSGSRSSNNTPSETPTDSEEILPAPLIIAAIASDNCNEGITLSWTRVSEVDGYYVDKKYGVSGNYSRISTITNSASTTYSHVPSDGDGFYIYKISAYKGDLISSGSVFSQVYYGGCEDNVDGESGDDHDDEIVVDLEVGAETPKLIYPPSLLISGTPFFLTDSDRDLFDGSHDPANPNPRGIFTIPADAPHAASLDGFYIAEDGHITSGEGTHVAGVNITQENPNANANVDVCRTVWDYYGITAPMDGVVGYIPKGIVTTAADSFSVERTEVYEYLKVCVTPAGSSDDEKLFPYGQKYVHLLPTTAPTSEEAVGPGTKFPLGFTEDEFALLLRTKWKANIEFSGNYSDLAQPFNETEHGNHDTNNAQISTSLDTSLRFGYGYKGMCLAVGEGGATYPGDSRFLGYSGYSGPYGLSSGAFGYQSCDENSPNNDADKREKYADNLNSDTPNLQNIEFYERLNNTTTGTEKYRDESEQIAERPIDFTQEQGDKGYFRISLSFDSVKRVEENGQIKLYPELRIVLIPVGYFGSLHTALSSIRDEITPENKIEAQQVMFNGKPITLYGSATPYGALSDFTFEIEPDGYYGYDGMYDEEDGREYFLAERFLGDVMSSADEESLEFTGSVSESLANVGSSWYTKILSFFKKTIVALKERSLAAIGSLLALGEDPEEPLLSTVSNITLDPDPTLEELAKLTNWAAVTNDDDLKFSAKNLRIAVAGGCQDIILNQGEILARKPLGTSFERVQQSQAAAQGYTEVCKRPFSASYRGVGYNDQMLVWSSKDNPAYSRDWDSRNELFVSYPSNKALAASLKKGSVMSSAKVVNNALLKNYYMVIENPTTHAKVRAAIVTRGGNSDSLVVSQGVVDELGLTSGDKVNVLGLEPNVMKRPHLYIGDAQDPVIKLAENDEKANPQYQNKRKVEIRALKVPAVPPKNTVSPTIITKTQEKIQEVKKATPAVVLNGLQKTMIDDACVSLKEFRANGKVTVSDKVYPNQKGQLIPEIAWLASIIPKKFQQTQILSLYRSPQHNREIGGAATSAHMRGEAIDITDTIGSVSDDMLTSIGDPIVAWLKADKCGINMRIMIFYETRYFLREINPNTKKIRTDSNGTGHDNHIHIGR